MKRPSFGQIVDVVLAAAIVLTWVLITIQAAYHGPLIHSIEINIR